MSLTNGFSQAAPITPNDTTDQVPYDSVQVASIAGGAVVVIIPAQGATVTYTGVTVGLIIPIKVKRVLTGTLATLVGLRGN